MAVQQKLITVAEFERFLSREENSGRLFELIEGEIVEKMPTEEHGIISLRLGSKVLIFVDLHKLGRVGVEIRHGLPDDEYNERLPDISFRAGLEHEVVKEGTVPQMPDLGVEIKSPDDSLKKMRAKARYYLENGTRLVWLVLPKERLVEVYAPDFEDILTENQILDGRDVLPGFRLPVVEIFQV